MPQPPLSGKPYHARHAIEPRKLRGSRALALGLALCAWPIQAAAQAVPAEPKPTAAASQSPARPAATRADLAVAYLRFEQAFLATALDATETVRVNRSFDALTLAFFSRDSSGAIRQLDALTSSLRPGATRSFDDRMAPYRLRMMPRVFVAGTGQPAVSVDVLYRPSDPAGTITTTMRWRRVDGQDTIDVPIEIGFPADGPPAVKAALSAAAARLRPGRYEIGFADGQAFVPGGTWSVVSKPLGARAAANAAALAGITPSTPALFQALASTEARNALLVDVPDPSNTAQMLFDPEVLAAQVESEVAALRRGVDPFKDRAGDYWRVLKTDGRTVPLRVYRPANVPASRPIPLVIALHGAGGDENMFMDAYGGGLIKRLADRHGFLVVSPQTSAFTDPASAGDIFDRLIEAIGNDHAIDQRRVYVVGHSMGGMAATGLVALRSDRIAAAACVNGFSGFKDGLARVAPTLVTAGELDPVVSASRIEPLATKAQAAGLAVEYRLLKGYGHTLAVTHVLPDAIAWLLAKNRQ